MAFQIRRGTDDERLTVIPAVGELIYTTDDKEVYIGDGSTVGGVLLRRPTTTAPLTSPVYTIVQARALTGAVGQQVCISNSPTVAGKIAFWDTTNSRWSYIYDNSAV
jgi:hypothetical protein